MRPPWLLLLLGGAITTIVACTGAIGDRADSGDGDDDGCVGCAPDGVQVAESTRFPRMSHRQWENTVVDLFQLDAPTGLSATFAPDPLGGKAFDNNNASLEVTPNLWADYQTAAETVAEMVTADPTLLSHIVPADLPSDPAAKADAWITDFGQRAYRRPLSGDEIAELQGLFDQGPTHFPDLDPFTAGVRLTLEGILQAPYFIYRAELGDQITGNDLIELDDYEMASRLSYTLWDSMPDPDLFAAAERGELTTDDGLEAQIDRLLGSDRARATIRSFFDQMGNADQYENLSKSSTVYPDFDPAIGADMREELARFTEYVVMDQNGGLEQLLTDRTTFVTAPLAEIYGLDPATLDYDADGFAKVTLDEAERAGILTRSGFLAWKGTESQPDTILRGVYVNRRFICQTLGDPPDAAMGAKLGDEATNRERVNALTGPNTCGASCHGTYINPAGYAFEHYGALGEWRDTDSGHDIDSASTFPFADGDKSYKDAVEFSNVLAASPQAHSCFSRYWVEFVLARDVVDADTALIDQLSDDSQAGAPIREVLKHLMTSAAFRYRLANVQVQP